jgi:PAS domain S-box-containing protein
VAGSDGDITERRAAEAALNEQRTELRQIIDVVPHMLFVKDEDGRYVIVNRAFAAAYGVHPHEVVGKRDADLGVQPAEAERHRAEERDVMHTGMPRFLPGESQSDDGGREYDALRVVFHRAGTDQLACSASCATSRRRSGRRSSCGVPSGWPRWAPWWVASRTS